MRDADTLLQNIPLALVGLLIVFVGARDHRRDDLRRSASSTRSWQPPGDGAQRRGLRPAADHRHHDPGADLRGRGDRAGRPLPHPQHPPVAIAGGPPAQPRGRHRVGSSCRARTASPASRCATRPPDGPTAPAGQGDDDEAQDHGPRGRLRCRRRGPRREAGRVPPAGSLPSFAPAATIPHPGFPGARAAASGRPRAAPARSVSARRRRVRQRRGVAHRRHGDRGEVQGGRPGRRRTRSCS